MSIHGYIKQSFIAYLSLLGGLTVLGANIEIYPFEPVVISIPYLTNHLNNAFHTNAVISCPNGVVITNDIGGANLLGTSNGNSMFFLCNPRTNIFCHTGTYQVRLAGNLSTVTVLSPLGQDASVVSILENMTLFEIMLNRERCDLNEKLKSKSQQILSISSEGHYSVFAKAYLAVDSMYSALESLYGKPVAPDFSHIGSDMVALSVPEKNLRWMVLFNKAMAFGIRGDKQNARVTCMALTNGIQNSVWSPVAEKYLLSTQ